MVLARGDGFVGRGFEAAGTVGRPGNQRVIVWSSRDGIGWHAREPAGTGLSDWGAQAITALTSSGSLVTGVGYVATPGAEQPTLWRAAAASGTPATRGTAPRQHT